MSVQFSSVQFSYVVLPFGGAKAVRFNKNQRVHYYVVLRIWDKEVESSLQSYVIYAASGRRSRINKQKKPFRGSN